MASPSKPPTSKALQGKGPASKAKVPRPEVSPEEDEDEDLDDLADTDSEAEESPARTSATKSGKLKKKKKKKSSGNATFYVVLGLGIFFGISVLAAGGVAIWYFLNRKTPESAVREFIYILRSFIAALEKAQDSSRRREAASDINKVADQVDRWIEKYKDEEFSSSDVRRASERYKQEIEELAKRAASLRMQSSINIFDPQDEEFVSAILNFVGKLSRIGQEVRWVRESQTFEGQGLYFGAKPPFPSYPRR
jgi:hypothetical protein